MEVPKNRHHTLKLQFLTIGNTLADREPRNTLPKGFWLNEYQIESVLGKPGGFGITYLAIDTNLRQKMAIKEYLPTDFAIREGISTVYVRSTSDEDSFKWGLKCFLDEARVLARFNHTNIVRVLRYFEANGTAYMVMEYQEGKCFTDYLKEVGTLDENRLLEIVEPLLSGLAEIHKADLLHRDIKPNNIYIRHDGSPVLLDFGSARYAVGQKTRSVTTIVTPGYAPLEQYDNEISAQGPWTDIYALGAMMYCAISGEPPPAATRRVIKDPMTPAVKLGPGKYHESLLRAIDWALQLSEEDRPRSVEEWRKTFLPSGNISANWSPPPVTPKSVRTNKIKWCCWVGGGLSVLLMIFIWFGWQQSTWLHQQEIQAILAKEQAARQKIQGQLEHEKAQKRHFEELLKEIKRLQDNAQFEGKTAPQFLNKDNVPKKFFDTVGVPLNDTLSVRVFPNHISWEVGEIPTNGKCVLYLGQFRTIGESVWVQVQYKKTLTGWVNSKYLAEHKESDCLKEYEGTIQ